MSDKRSSKVSEKGQLEIQHHWRKDLIAAFSVALVALPLALGIAAASGAPPIAGLLSAIVGGIVTTFIRGSHVAINGPGNSLIVIVIIAADQIRHGNENVYPYVLAVFIVSGILQTLLGVLRMGKFGDFFPSSVIYGMLGAIGIIIMGKQIHVSLGVQSEAESTLGVLREIPNSILHLNPFITCIAVVSLLILVLYPKTKNKIIRAIPAPMWVLLLAIPQVFFFNFFEPHTIRLLDRSFHVGPENLVQIPNDILQSFVFPDFSRITEGGFWLGVITITLVSYIETLVSAKAVDKLDPYKRRTNLNKELIGVGTSTVAAACVGGLPIFTVIARSSVNVNHGARTRWSNFFHGAILLVFVFVGAEIIQEVPLAALAAILVFTGYKLASPQVFKEMYQHGWEQLAIFLITLVATLVVGLLGGIAIGIAFTLLIHYFLSGIPFPMFVNYLFKPSIRIIQEKRKMLLFKVKGIASFMNILHLRSKVQSISHDQHVVMDFSHTRLVDHTVLEYLHEHAEKYNNNGGQIHFTGLDIHQTSSFHPNALHILKTPKPKRERLTQRQQGIKLLADTNGYDYRPEINWDISSKIRRFNFFKSRPIEFEKNQLYGDYASLGVDWKISDVTFDEGALIAKEVYHITLQILHLPFDPPVFSMEKEGFIDKILMVAEPSDIDFQEFKHFSKKFLLKSPDEKSIRKFFTPELIHFFERNDIYHLESNGKALLVFKHVRLVSPNEIMKMISFSERLVKRLQKEVMTPM